MKFNLYTSSPFLAFLVGLLVVNLTVATDLFWINSGPSNLFSNSGNWDASPPRVPNSGDDAYSINPNSYILVDAVTNVKNLFQSSNNNSLVFNTVGTLTASSSNHSLGASVFLESYNFSQKLISTSSYSLFNQSSLTFKSGVLQSNNLIVVQSAVSLLTTNKQIFDTARSVFTNTPIQQQTGSNTTFTNAPRLTYSSWSGSPSSTLNVQGPSVNEFRSTQINITNNSAIRGNDYYLQGTTQLKVTLNSFAYFQNLYLIGAAQLYVDNSLFQFNSYLYGMLAAPSPNGFVFKNFAKIQGTNASGEFYINHRSVAFFENTIFDLQAKITAVDNAKIIFSNFIIPLRPIYIHLRGCATIQFQINLGAYAQSNDGVHVNKQTGERIQTPKLLLGGSSISAANETIGNTVFDLDESSSIEFDQVELSSVVVNANGKSKVTFGTNVLFTDSTITNQETPILIETPIQISNSVINAVSGSNITVNGGSIEGNGNINGDLSIIGGGRLGSTDQVNRFTVNGNVKSSESGSFGIKIASPTSFSQINITNDFEFNGTLLVHVDANAVQSNATFNVITYGSLIGQPTNITVVSSSPNITIQAITMGLGDGTTAISLQVTPTNQDKEKEVTLEPSHISAIVIGSVLVIAGVIIGSVLMVRHRRRNQKSNKTNSYNEQIDDNDSISMNTL